MKPPLTTIRRALLILAILCALLACLRVGAADIITATVSITNNPVGNTNTLTVSSSTRTWTNSVSAAPSTLIAQTNSPANAATNLLTHLGQYPASFAHYVSQSTSTNVTIRGAVGEALSVTAAGGWAAITFSTQTVASAIVVRVPLSVEATTNRTNIASMLVDGLQHSTNAIGTNWTAASNLLVRGASPQQYVAGPVQFNGVLRAGAAVAITNGFTSALTNINSVSSNHINFGNALQSHGPGGNSLQIGSNAWALGTRSVAIGNGAIATNSDSIAVGTTAIATNAEATALGISARAGGDRAIAVGKNATAATNETIALGYSAAALSSQAISIGLGGFAGGSGGFGQIAIGNEPQALNSFDIAIGYAAFASAGNAIALGQGATVTHTNSTAIGYSATSTRTNEIVLGTSAERITIPGQIENARSTNSTWRGTNILNGSVILTSRANTGLANGNNAGIVLGTNVLVNLSGATTIATIAGFAAAPADTWHTVRISGAVTNIIANESGVDPTAANRITTGTGGDITLTNAPAYISLRYNGTSSRWELIHWTR